MEDTAMNGTPAHQESRKLWQYLASISACMLVVGVGTALAWTSTVLPQLSSADSWLFITEEQGSWISSLLAVGAIAGALCSGSMADKMGRKKSLLLLSVPFLVSWGLILVAKNVRLLYIARFVAGVGVGAGCVLGPTYISEIAEVSTKGTLGALFQLFLTVGIFAAFILGSVLNYTMFALVCALIIVLFLVTFYWMPESPVWLVNQNRRQDALAALSVLRGNNYDPKQEVNEMQKAAEASAGRKPSLIETAKDPVNKKAMVASFGMMIFQQASGVNAVIFYTVMIFKASGSSIPPELASILVALVQLVMSGVAALIVDRAGRKPLLMISTSVMSVSLIALGYYFHQKDGGNDVSSLGWLPLVSLVVFMVAFSIGLGPIPWMLMGELFSAETKAIASSIAVMLNWSLVFVVTKMFPTMNEELGSDVTFWIFAVVMAAAAAYTYMLLPETKGKTYQEIHDELQAGDGGCCWSSLSSGGRVGRIVEARFAGRRKRRRKGEEVEAFIEREALYRARRERTVREREREMAPTYGEEEIEGRYKEYAYSPVPSSSSSAVCDSTTLGKYPVEIGFGSFKHCTNGVHDKCRVANMAEKGSTLPQYVAAAAANLCCVASGALLGWTSPVLPNLGSTLEDNPLGRTITADENSWIGSLISVGAIIGSFVAGYLAERWGRKMTLLSSVVPFLIGWVLIATAGVVYQLFVARIVLGFALAFAFTVVPMYCGEIAETSVRGALGSFLQLFVTIGLLYAYAIGPFVSYVAFAIVCAVPPVVFFACFFVMPESPYHLIKVGKREEAVQALARLRKKSPASVQKEADEIQAAIDDAFRNEAKISDLFKVKANLKALIFTCLLVAFQQCSGINVVLFYMGSIFKSAHSALPDSISTIIVGAVQTATSSITPLICDKLGRRMLLITSGIGEIVSLIALGLYMFLQDVEKSDVSGISWLPIVSLVIFIALYCIGWGPLPWTVMGEMFASNVKSKASGITVSVCWLVSFFITKFASDLQEVFGQYLLFWLFAVFCVLSVLFTFFILPETKGKSLQQIQNELSGEHSEIPEFGDSSKQ